MDDIDRRIINHLQDGFPIVAEPYAEVASRLGIAEEDLIDRLQALLYEGALSRFGPLFNAERMGGALTLCAMAVGEARFEEVAGIVNSYTEVAHNYARAHNLNMWFVLATDAENRILEVIADIERRCGLRVYNLPKTQEYFVGLKLCV